MDDDINQIIRYKTISIDNGNISITETIIAVLNNGEVIYLSGVDETEIAALEAKGATIN